MNRPARDDIGVQFTSWVAEQLRNQVQSRARQEEAVRIGWMSRLQDSVVTVLLVMALAVLVWLHW